VTKLKNFSCYIYRSLYAFNSWYYFFVLCFSDCSAAANAHLVTKPSELNMPWEPKTWWVCFYVCACVHEGRRWSNQPDAWTQDKISISQLPQPLLLALFTSQSVIPVTCQSVCLVSVCACVCVCDVVVWRTYRVTHTKLIWSPLALKVMPCANLRDFCSAWGGRWLPSRWVGPCLLDLLGRVVSLPIQVGVANFHSPVMRWYGVLKDKPIIGTCYSNNGSCCCSGSQNWS